MARIFKVSRKRIDEFASEVTIGGVTITITGTDNVIKLECSSDLTPPQRAALQTALENRGLRIRYEA